MKKLILSLIAVVPLSFAVSLPAWADSQNDVGNCAIGGLIAGGIAQMSGSRNVGGAAAVGCGGGTLLGRSVQNSPSSPHPEYQYPQQHQQRRHQPPVYVYQNQQPDMVYVPPVCEKYSYDQAIMASCARSYAQEQSKIEQEGRRAAEVRRQSDMRRVDEEARQAARSGGY
jgi:hypothetical protein